MNVGWIGLGKLGLTCALTLEKYGQHHVVGYDVSSRPTEILAGRATPPREQGIEELLDSTNLKVLGSVRDVVAVSQVVFIAVQTPHAMYYGGSEPAPEKRQDFDYSALVQAFRDVTQAAATLPKAITVVVVSTVLPGTVNRLLRPLLNSFVTLIYSPAFIAMGTTVADYRNPEFVICGVDKPTDSFPLVDVFEPVHGKSKLFVTDVETAEAIKVFYNTYISSKIVFANSIMEICHKTGADCDKVIDALSLATDRVISPKYLRGGMGDGGACHPRDLIALSWLSERLSLSYDLFGDLVRAREAQTRWLAELAFHHSDVAHLPIVILGKAYKPGSDLTYGSPASLLAHELDGAVKLHFDPYVDHPPEQSPEETEVKPAVVVIATKHPEFQRYKYQRGCVILDPFGYIPDLPGVTVIRIGRKN